MNGNISRRGCYSRVYAYLSAIQVLPVGIQDVNLDAVLFDSLGEFDIATYRFTALKAGYYLFIAQASYNCVGAIVRQYMMIQFSDAINQAQNSKRMTAFPQGDYLTVSHIRYLEAGQQAWLQYNGSLGAGVASLIPNPQNTCLKIHRLS